ncbi:hypothetical protein [Alicyclobacillus vulcanalis]|uniref:Uncharacterized protein n=1 Tax=Alicyclobacillus vulcanalis TaxID=252246 RepID=A0A1N7NN59_9BACL|nr:hypothetical protein [Alicyclobacillus vulcanalis]SIS99717.1 hypothetical protein SAMN05421799_10942 [Alicyclobacillus vulcanalis]
MKPLYRAVLALTAASVIVAGCGSPTAASNLASSAPSAAQGASPARSVAPNGIAHNVSRQDHGQHGASSGLSAPPASAAPAASATAVATPSGVGWYAVPLGRAYGDLAAIAGVDPEGARVRLVVRADAQGSTAKARLEDAWFTPSTGAFQPAGSVPAQTQRSYAGPVHLVFSNTFPTSFQPVQVTVEVDGRHAAKWPSAVPMYGSLVNPETLSPGSWDNVVLGQVGDWVWVALKGPQYPPLYPHSWPITWGFRVWNRVVAFNVVTGAAVVYSVPRSYGLGSWSELTTPNEILPSFAEAGGRVYVGIGEWLGVLPAVPPGQVPAGAVHASSVAIRLAPNAAYVAQEDERALDTLRSFTDEAARVLASYWDTEAGVHVSGVPAFSFYQRDMERAWNLDPAIVNHGDLPTELLWAMSFPVATGSEAVMRRRLSSEVLSMLQSPLQQDAYGMVVKTPSQVMAQFHGRPPLQLPGFSIRGNAYVPNS